MWNAQSMWDFVQQRSKRRPREREQNVPKGWDIKSPAWSGHSDKCSQIVEGLMGATGEVPRRDPKAGYGGHRTW